MFCSTGSRITAATRCCSQTKRTDSRSLKLTACTRSRCASGMPALGTWQGIYLVEHRARPHRRDIVLQMPRHYGVQRGTFALRSPARPNPIAMSVVRLLKVDGNTLTVIGLDCLDGTPLIDIKPYFASTDAVSDAVVGWHKARNG